jgi:hypothetical protein
MNIPNDLSIEKLNVLVRALIQSDQPITLTTYTFPRSTEQYMEQALSIFFEEVKQQEMADYVIYFVKELIGNAKKANSKRVYFAEKGLDIHKEEDYEEGMKTFKSDLLEKNEYYLSLQRKLKLYIKLKLWKKGEKIKIEVSNNARITAMEEERMISKIKIGKQYKALENIMTATDAIDDIEGSGLGLIILVLMMKKMGTAAEKIKIVKEDNETTIRVEMPISNYIKQKMKDAEEAEEILEL